MKVELLSHMGSDLTVVNTARVSFAKESSYEESRDGTWSLSEKDKNLISYLAKHNHWSPFSHCFVSFRIKAPLFVARQLQKHQVGLSWNEVSRRYVDSKPEFYYPTAWRKKAENVKQGSSDEIFEVDQGDLEDFYKEITEAYLLMIEAGVCAEQARMLLPQSMYTEWIWSGSLYAFSRVCNLRLDSHTQRETQEIARQISGYMKNLFPVSWKELLNEN